MELQRIITPIHDFAGISWLALSFMLMAYVLVRGIIMQGGLYLWVIRAGLALRKRVYRLPFTKGQLLSELRASLVSLIIDGFFIAGLIKVLPPNTNAHNVGVTFLLSFVWFEIWFYASHRFLHRKRFYFLHRQHHVATVTSPFTALSFSAIERLILLVGGLGFIGWLGLFMPISPLGVALYLFVNYALNIFGHLNVELVPPALLKSFWGADF